MMFVPVLIYIYFLCDIKLSITYGHQFLASDYWRQSQYLPLVKIISKTSLENDLGLEAI